MELGKNIHNLRVKNNLTQKDLSEMLHVTSQAVSRWEQGIVEPSLATIKEMATIFNVTVDELVNYEAPEIEDTESTNVTAEDIEKIVDEKIQGVKRTIAICDKCKKPILEGDPIHEMGIKNHTYYCEDCFKKMKAKEKSDKLAFNKKSRKRGWIYATIGAVVWLALMIVAVVSDSTHLARDLPIGIFGSIALFTFIYCCCAHNNFVADLWLRIASWGFVRMPGLIFSLDLDGIFWLLTVKLFLFILGFFLAALSIVFATIIGAVCSLAVFPFAVKWSYQNPEKAEEF